MWPYKNMDEMSKFTDQKIIRKGKKKGPYVELPKKKKTDKAK